MLNIYFTSKLSLVGDMQPLLFSSVEGATTLLFMVLLESGLSRFESVEDVWIILTDLTLKNRYAINPKRLRANPMALGMSK